MHSSKVKDNNQMEIPEQSSHVASKTSMIFFYFVQNMCKRKVRDIENDPFTPGRQQLSGRRPRFQRV